MPVVSAWRGAKQASSGPPGAVAWGRVIGVGMVVLACLVVPFRPAPATAAMPPPPPVQISIDMDYKTVKAGDHILFNTVLTNPGPQNSSPMAVAMNIVNLKAAGDVVDPEDWSPQRTQYRETLAPGQPVSLSWRVNAILDGNF